MIPQHHSAVLAALVLLEGRVVDPDAVVVARPGAGPRERYLPRGLRVRLRMVKLPEVKKVPTMGTDLARARWRRDNVARQVWQLQDMDGEPLRLGLYVDRRVLLEVARQRGFVVVDDDDDRLSDVAQQREESHGDDLAQHYLEDVEA